MNKDDFHIPFLHGMIIVAVVTIISMTATRHFIRDYYFSHNKTPVYTSYESDSSPE